MFRTILNDKIGNLINYLATKIPWLSLTKALKLMYIIDETSIKEVGSPITWLDYKVWENGPVAEDIYNEVKYNQRTYVGDKDISVDKYVTIDRRFNAEKGREEIYFIPKPECSLGSFSPFDMEIIDGVIKKFGKYTAPELIDYLHREDSLWAKVCNEENLQLHFKIYSKKSNYSIDFSELIKDDEMLQMAAHSAYESLSFQESLGSDIN
jgi:uncharacterized phage-associated protein